jgi:hypothetical protein
MLSWLRNLVTKPAPALKGVPKVRREKTYSAETGYVYQYFYQGYREGKRGEEEGDEHLFSVSSDRASRFTLRVFLSRQVVEQWEHANDRKLIPTEQYALVKLSLFEAFDARTDFADGNSDVLVGPEQVEEHIKTLDL